MGDLIQGEIYSSVCVNEHMNALLLPSVVVKRERNSSGREKRKERKSKLNKSFLPNCSN